MIRSMTGYGKRLVEVGDRQVSIEARSLNSKFLDINLKVPPLFKEKEIEIRNLLSQKLQRGKAELSLTMESMEGDKDFFIDKRLFKGYYQELKGVMDEIEVSGGDMVNALLKIPNVLQTQETVLDEEEWNQIMQGIAEALDNLNEFRDKEGETLESDFLLRVKNIKENLTGVEQIEGGRIERIKERIDAHVSELKNDSAFDENRYEQEMIYYIEKLDITEEIVRLKSHCDYFLEVMSEKEDVKGKKLNFIGQEMGREINTIGSKASDAKLQKLVIQMKEELEKIKEQLGNVL